MLTSGNIISFSDGKDSLLVTFFILPGTIRSFYANEELGTNPGTEQLEELLGGNYFRRLIQFSYREIWLTGKDFFNVSIKWFKDILKIVQELNEKVNYKLWN